MLSDLRFTTERLVALRDVHRGQVRFHNGLTSRAGYDYSEPGRPMAQDVQDTLSELWLAGLIDIDADDLFVHDGNKVTLSYAGWGALQRWGFSPTRHAA